MSANAIQNKIPLAKKTWRVSFPTVKVSVLIPTYNSERHLAECLDSVLAQDFADMEILISDDNSRDDTVKLIETYAARDARIRWWRNPQNLGFVANHNFCLQQARGEYVKFIHADDKLLSNSAIQKMAAALDTHPSVVLTGCRLHLTGGKSKPSIFFKKAGQYEGWRLIIACLEQNNNFIGQPVLTMFRRRAAGRGFDDRFVGHLDYEMWCHLLEQGDFYYLAETLATWRIHETQQTAKNAQNGLADHEHLTFITTYYAKPWMAEVVTDRMLFTQIHYLHKKYGGEAKALTTAMKSQLKPHQFAWQWLRHKVGRPLQKISRKLGAGQ